MRPSGVIGKLISLLTPLYLNNFVSLTDLASGFELSARGDTDNPGG